MMKMKYTWNNKKSNALPVEGLVMSIRYVEVSSSVKMSRLQIF